MRREHVRQVKQAAWYDSSPVIMASSRMGFLQTLQLYEHEVHTGLPSESSSKLVSAVTLLPHFAHLKHATCQRDVPNATTTPPVSDSTVRLQPPQSLSGPPFTLGTALAEVDGNGCCADSSIWPGPLSSAHGAGLAAKVEISY